MRIKSFPILGWLADYKKSEFSGDLIAGTIVAIVLLPQAMAYAMLAGLPPQIGLYSCIVPILMYAVFGTSRTLAVGPVGLMSLMVGSEIVELQIADEPHKLSVAVLLALLSGIMLVLLHVLKFGSAINFISHPVLSGFTSAAALIIGVSQLKHLFGLEVPKSVEFHESVSRALEALPASLNIWTTSIGLASITIMVGLRLGASVKCLERSLPTVLVQMISRSGPLVSIFLGIMLVGFFKLEQADMPVAIVGNIPSGLPPLKLPAIDWELVERILPIASVIAIVGYLESVSVAKALAGRRRQKIDANQELLALGCANIGAAFSGGYPVSGGLGRSMVNFSSGANTQISALVSAFLMALVLLLLTPLFYYLPKSVLAAIIIVAVSGLFDLKTMKQVWVYDRSEGLCLIATFIAVLMLGIEWGILLGALIAIGYHLKRSSRPHVAVVGRIANTEHFRNVARHEVLTCPHVLAMRIDENLYFANIAFIEDYIMALIADNRNAKHLVLICSAVNTIDSSALELLDSLVERLREIDVTLHLSEVKGPVMDRLKKTPFLAKLGPGKIFLSTHEAMTELECNA